MNAYMYKHNPHLYICCWGHAVIRAWWFKLLSEKRNWSGTLL